MSEYFVEQEHSVSWSLDGPYGRFQNPTLILLHSTRSGRSESTWTLDNELSATLNWFKTGKAGAHAVIAGDGDVYWTAPLDRQSWGASYLNPRAMHIELCQPTINHPYNDAQYAGALEAIARIHGRWPDIPLVRIWDENGTGLIAHSDTQQGKLFGKSDPGPQWDWDRLFSLLEDNMPRTPEQQEIINVIRVNMDQRSEEIKGDLIAAHQALADSERNIASAMTSLGSAHRDKANAANRIAVAQGRMNTLDNELTEMLRRIEQEWA